MSRCKLRVPEPGTMLYGDDGRGMVADTLADARRFWLDHDGEVPMFMHSSIGRCRVVCKADMENGDCHEDAEPGDTTLDYLHDDGRDLKDNEVRVWELGAPRVEWRMEPLRPEPINPDEIPAGASVYHRRLGSGETTRPGVKRGGWWWLPCAFGGVERLVKVSLISILRSGKWPGPPTRYRLTVEGEHVADGDQWALHTLLDARKARLRAEWEAENFDPAVLAMGAIVEEMAG